MKINKWLTFFSCLLMMCLLCACKQNKGEQRSLLLDDPVCLQPCWQNIYPGETTFADAVEILRESMLFNSTRFSPTPTHINGYSGWVFKEEFLETTIVVQNVGDSVGMMEFSTNDEINAGELINIYGEPDYISVISGMTDSRWLSVIWLYPEKGVVISHFDSYWKPTGEFAEITPDFPIFFVYYFKPTLYEYFFEKKTFFPTYDDTVVRSSIQPWKGFGLVPYTLE